MSIHFSPARCSQIFLAWALAWGVHTAAHADPYQDVQRLVRNQQWTQAQQAASTHLQSHPGDPQMRLLLSQIQSGQADNAAAQATLQQLTLDYPELPEPHNNLAALYAAQGRLDLALLSLKAAIAARPDYALALENLGDLYLQLALQAFNQASDGPGSSNNLGDKRARLGALIKSAP